MKYEETCEGKLEAHLERIIAVMLSERGRETSPEYAAAYVSFALHGLGYRLRTRSMRQHLFAASFEKVFPKIRRSKRKPEKTKGKSS